jgi:hypothetical protein
LPSAVVVGFRQRRRRSMRLPDPAMTRLAGAGIADDGSGAVICDCGGHASIKSRAARPASVMAQPRSRRSIRPRAKISRTGHAGPRVSRAFRPLPSARRQNGHITLDDRESREAVGVAHQHLEDGHLKVHRNPTQHAGQAALSRPNLPNFSCGSARRTPGKLRISQTGNPW